MNNSQIYFGIEWKTKQKKKKKKKKKQQQQKNNTKNNNNKTKKTKQKKKNKKKKKKQQQQKKKTTTITKNIKSSPNYPSYLSLCLCWYKSIITPYQDPTCKGGIRHLGFLISNLFRVIKILCNPNCVFKFRNFYKT